MSSREQILAAVKANKPAEEPTPPVMQLHTDTAIQYENVVEQFTTIAQSIGATVHAVENMTAVKLQLEEALQDGKQIVNTIAELGTVTANIDIDTPAVQLEAVDIAYINGTVGVAENAAIWVSEEQMVNRALPFICKQLVLIINQQNLVSNMHQAYGLLNVAADGFGAFIAGPSKTADIEQSLVIGAHGPLGLTVYIITNA